MQVSQMKVEETPRTANGQHLQRKSAVMTPQEKNMKMMVDLKLKIIQLKAEKDIAQNLLKR